MPKDEQSVLTEISRDFNFRHKLALDEQADNVRARDGCVGVGQQLGPVLAHADANYASPVDDGLAQPPYRILVIAF